MTKRWLKMIATTKGKDDDPTSAVREYLAGVAYPVGPQLFKAFVEDLRVAVEANEAGEPFDDGLAADRRETKVVAPPAKKPAPGGGAKK